MGKMTPAERLRQLTVYKLGEILMETSGSTTGEERAAG